MSLDVYITTGELPIQTQSHTVLDNCAITPTPVADLPRPQKCIDKTKAIKKLPTEGCSSQHSPTHGYHFTRGSIHPPITFPTRPRERASLAVRRGKKLSASEGNEAVPRATGVGSTVHGPGGRRLIFDSQCEVGEPMGCFRF